MGDSFLNIGVSGLSIAQRALTTTGHNIANANNPAYSRQRVDISSREPNQIAAGYLGNGARVDGISRLVDQYLVRDLRATTSSAEKTIAINELVTQLDNLLADPEAGLSPVIDRFFGAVQDVADDPASSSGRNVLLAESRILAQRFQQIDNQITGIEDAINSRLRDAISEINTLATGIADANEQIRLNQSRDANSQPNDLLDERDELIRQLSELVNVSVTEQQDGTVNVAIGSGQPLVVGVQPSRLAAATNEFEPLRVEVAQADVPGRPIISSFLTGGRVGGLLEARTDLIDDSRNILGRLAITLSATFNAQHRQGLDLEGNLGGDFFTDLTTAAPVVLPHVDNSTPAVAASAVVSDVTDLTTSDYELRVQAGRVSIERLADGEVTDVTADLGALVAAPGVATTTVDGVDLTFNGALVNGDRFLVQPTRQASRSMGLAVSNAAAIAAASPATSGADVDNAGSATVSPADVVDPLTYIPDNYRVVAAGDAGTAATDLFTGGEGVFTDVVGTDDPLVYDLQINGVTVHTQAEGDPALADVFALRDAINGAGDANVALTGVKAYVEGPPGAETLYLTQQPARNSAITVGERLTGASDPGDQFTGYFGTTLSGAAPTASSTIAAAADSYVVLDGAGATVTSGAYTSGSPITFNGVEVTVRGSAALGDTFRVDPNTFGVGDNRNALALADLQQTPFLNSGTASYQDAYGELVVEVGGLARETNIARDAQETLLENAVSARNTVSGVNLDEEAANILRFQQAYQAAAQIISVADEIFQELIGAVR